MSLTLSDGTLLSEELHSSLTVSDAGLGCSIQTDTGSKGVFVVFGSGNRKLLGG